MLRAVSRVISRAASLRALSAALGMALVPSLALGGAQREEPLTDAIRNVLSAAVRDHRSFDSFQPDAETDAVRRARWVSLLDRQLRRQIPEDIARQDFAQAVWYESVRAGLDVAMVLGLIEVESGFRRYAVSPAGARGYMQVMPFWTRVIGDGGEAGLFRLQTNLRYGCVILRHYLDREQGDWTLALGRYNGSRGQTAYPQAVFKAMQRWQVLWENQR